MDNNEWMEIRCQPSNSIYNACESILKEWCNECNVNQIAYDITFGEDCGIIIYTNRPGIMIGLYGVTVYKYQDIFQQEYGSNFKIEFKEIKGRFVYVNN